MKTSDFASKIGVAAGLMVALAGCNSTGGNSITETLDVKESRDQTQTAVVDPRAYCPKTVLRAGTETYRLFKKGVRKSDEGAMSSLRFQGNISEVVRECNYQGEILNIRVGIAGKVINGPTAETGTVQMPVRIAVTQGESVLYSELHQVNGTIEPGKSVGFFRFVDGNIYIPKPPRENIIVYAGFDEGPPEKTR